MWYSIISQMCIHGIKVRLLVQVKIVLFLHWALSPIFCIWFSVFRMDVSLVHEITVRNIDVLLITISLYKHRLHGWYSIWISFRCWPSIVLCISLLCMLFLLHLYVYFSHHTVYYIVKYIWNNLIFYIASLHFHHEFTRNGEMLRITQNDSLTFRHFPRCFTVANAPTFQMTILPTACKLWRIKRRALYLPPLVR